MSALGRASSVEEFEGPMDFKPSRPEVLEKYKDAASIANGAITFFNFLTEAVKYAISLCAENANVAEICRRVDDVIVELAGNLHGKAKVLKGVAFPTAISVNHCVCHYSPCIGDNNVVVLRGGDLVKIELGAHVDGFPAIIAHSIIVGASESNPATGRAADVVQAAHLAAEAAARLVCTGKSSEDVRQGVNAILADFDVTFIEGLVSNMVGKDRLSGEKGIIIRPSEAQEKSLKTHTFCSYDVFVVDIAVSSSSGKTRLQDLRPTVFSKNSNVTYSLKLKTSRAVFSEIVSKHGNMAFSIRSLGDATKARMGLSECVNHDMVTPYDVLFEKDESALVARFMFTTIAMPAGPLRLTDGCFSAKLIKPSRALVNPQLVELLNTPIDSETKKL